jgi:nitrite reductase/ring-hydroxylating ferredoxin subunit
MSKLVKVAKIGELEDGTKKEVPVNGDKVLLARVGDQYYACEARCPHWGWPLVRGKLEGTVLQCSFHYSRFDLRDGRVIRWTVGRDSLFDKLRYGFLSLAKKPRKLKTYKVKIEGDDILVEI